MMSDMRCCSIKIKRIHPDAQRPKYEHPGDSGADIYSIEDYILMPFERKAIATGLCAEVPDGYELQVRPKSGLSINSGITVLNTPGTVDSGYRGEIKVILINLSNESFQVKKGHKIAQIVITPVIIADFLEVDELSKSERDTSGFGSTGIF
jgi:dUTP pyrophosphatase